MLNVPRPLPVQCAVALVDSLGGAQAAARLAKCSVTPCRHLRCSPACGPCRRHGGGGRRQAQARRHGGPRGAAARGNTTMSSPLLFLPAVGCDCSAHISSKQAARSPLRVTGSISSGLCQYCLHRGLGDSHVFDAGVVDVLQQPPGTKPPDIQGPFIRSFQSLDRLDADARLFLTPCSSRPALSCPASCPRASSSRARRNSSRQRPHPQVCDNRLV